ncbi:VanZ family protein [Flavobacteriaceae bacterium LMO-SS05]
MAKHWALILLLTYLFLLTGVSLIKLAELPTLGSSFDDKIFHVLSHALLTVLCFNYFKKTRVSKPIMLSAFFPIFYGIIIEGLQGITSNLRTADGYDILANVLGTIFAILIISILIKVKLK